MILNRPVLESSTALVAVLYASYASSKQEERAIRVCDARRLREHLGPRVVIPVPVHDRLVDAYYDGGRISVTTLHPSDHHNIIISDVR